MDARRRLLSSLSLALPLAALVLGCPAVLPAARAGSDAGLPRRAAADGGDLVLPSLPLVVVTIRPEDLSPGESARSALSRLGAGPPARARPLGPPGTTAVATAVLAKDADVHPDPEIATATVKPAVAGALRDPGAAAAAHERAPARDPRPARVEAVVLTPAPPTPKALPALAPAPGRHDAAPAHAPALPIPGASPRPPLVSPAGAVRVAVADPATASAGGPPLPLPDATDRPALPPPEAISRPAAEASPPPGAAEVSKSGDARPDTEAAVLDATTLRAAVDAFVGPEARPTTAGGSTDEQARRKEREAIAAVYADRGFAPLWVEDGAFTAPAQALVSRIDLAGADGLDLRGTPIAVPRGGDPAALAAAELSLTRAIVAYGRQASGGRIAPSRLAPMIAAEPDVADAARILGAVSRAPDAGEALRAFNPPQPGYAALRGKLAELRQRGEMAGGRDPIPYGPILKPGMRDARVPLIRARFGLGLPADAEEADKLAYDTRVAAAVADFQRSRGMPASGLLTIRTIGALSGGNPRRLENEIVANMERWRWLPRDLGATHIEVNIPDYTLDVKRGDAVVHHARVVVGKPDHETPVFSQLMRFIIVNPYWNVPLSIVKKEMMPKLAADPNYFADHGYEVVEHDGVTFVRQPPGDGNALGHIKFMFPNKFSVYLHDTNARALFGNDQRAMSHGCVRVDQPFKLAETVLGPGNGWTEARIKKMVGGNERTINLPQPVPVHIVYFTAFVDATGALKLRDDVYGYSAKVRNALGLEG